MLRQPVAQAAILVALSLFGLGLIGTTVDTPAAHACYNSQYCGNPGYGNGYNQGPGTIVPRFAPNGMVWLVSLYGNQILVPAPPGPFQMFAANFQGGNFCGWLPRPCGDGGPCR